MDRLDPDRSALLLLAWYADGHIAHANVRTADYRSMAQSNVNFGSPAGQGGRMSDLFGSKMADSLRKFADCEHKQLTCCGCGATATMTSWLMPYLHENDALRERVAELRTLLLRYGNHLPQCVFEPIIGRPEECNCGWKDIRDAADAAGGDGE